jgi:Protein of unknown function (DUF2867)
VNQTPDGSTQRTSRQVIVDAQSDGSVLARPATEQGDGSCHGQMAVYVKPRGPFGERYMAFIKPIRYLVVYPALMGHIERAWNRRVATATPGAPV